MDKHIVYSHDVVMSSFFCYREATNTVVEKIKKQYVNVFERQLLLIMQLFYTGTKRTALGKYCDHLWMHYIHKQLQCMSVTLYS